MSLLSCERGEGGEGGEGHRILYWKSDIILRRFLSSKNPCLLCCCAVMLLCIPPWISCKSSVNKLIGLLTALVGLLEQFCWSQPEYLNFMIKDWELIVWAGTQNTVRFPRQEEGHSVTGVGKQETPQFCLLVYSNVGFDIRLGIYQRPPAFLSTVQHEHLCWNTK